MSLWRALTATLLVAALLAGVTVAAQEPERGKVEETRLRALEKDIQALRETLEKRDGERNALASQLRDQELAVAAINGKITTLDADIERLNQELAELAQRGTELEQQSKAQQQMIARDLEAAFRLGRAEPLKLLLNQEEPDQLNRTLKYYRYFIDARSARIEGYRALMAELETIEADIAGRQDELAASRLELESQQAALAASNTKRREVLAALDQELDSEQARLAELDQQRKELEDILARLQEAIHELAAPTSEPFPTLRGKLPWPTEGRILQAYGSMRAQNLPWTGWLIAADEGTAVNAVHPGRVVFSDYLRGHGLVLIIDHGDDYLSLYAHNQVLLKEPGDWVKQGERIALVGKSGGLEDSALYFEIRHNGRPQDPRNWLARR
ncbi:MAG TPA: peptidoglycan DD-metalloendopeptidase family protein [Porticoccaceae bacterium]